MNILVISLILCYGIVFIVYLPMANNDRVLSIYSRVDKDTNLDIETSKRRHRLQEALHHVSSLNSEKSLKFHNTRLLSSHVNHLLVALVKEGDHANDKSDNLYSLLHSMDEIVQNHEDFALVICNATRNNKRKALNLLSKMYPTFDVHIQSLYSINEQNILKEAFVQCTKHSNSLLRNNQSNIFTIFSENVLPYESFANDVTSLLKFRLENKFQSGEIVSNSGNWLFLSLRESSYLKNFHIENLSSLYELCMIFLAGSLLFFVAFQFSDPHLSSGSLVLTAIAGGIYFSTFALVFGRPYIAELRRISPFFYRLYDPREAVEFSAISVSWVSLQKLHLYLATVSCTPYHPFHKALDGAINSFEIPGYVISPSLVRYV